MMFGQFRLRRPAPGTVLGGLALIVATSGVAVAAIPSTGGVITTCFNKSQSVWRPVDTEAGAKCRSGEIPLEVYSKAGADAAFLGETAKASDADKLDSLDSTDFLRSNAAAGGDLAGNYPNPSIGASKVTSSHIFDGTVGVAELANSAVTTPKLNDGAVTTSKLDSDAVTTSKLKDGSVTTAKFDAAAKAPDADKLDGKDAADFLGTGDKVGDADTLDGKDSTAFQPKVTESCLAKGAIGHIWPDGSVYCYEPGYRIVNHPFTLEWAKFYNARLDCPSGERVIEVGLLSNDNGSMILVQSYPVNDGHSWSVQVAHRDALDPHDRKGELKVICMSTG